MRGFLRAGGNRALTTPEAAKGKTAWKYRGTTSGGWAKLYIEAKIDLCKNGKKGGVHTDLVQWAKDHGYNMGTIPGTPGAPATKEAAAEFRALARMGGRGGGSSSKVD